MKVGALNTHRDAIIIDGMYHSLLVDPPHAPAGVTPIDLLLDAGVTAINVSVTMDIYPSVDLKAGLREIYNHLVLFDALPDKTVQVLSQKDIYHAKSSGKLGVIFGTQGTALLEGDIRYVTLLQKLGIRIMQLTYNERSAVGCGCLEQTDTGLTRFGLQLIREMNRVGVLIDLSHAGLRTSLEALGESSAPAVFSHSGVKRLVEHPRNLTDEQIRLVAASGGLVGLCPHSIMCQRESTRPSLDDYIDKIDYVVQMVGIDHAGIGTDRFMESTIAYELLRTAYERTVKGFFGQFGGDEKHVKGFSRLSEWLDLTASLLRRGYTDADVCKILGGNFLGVFRDVWDGAETNDSTEQSD